MWPDRLAAKHRHGRKQIDEGLSIRMVQMHRWHWGHAAREGSGSVTIAFFTAIDGSENKYTRVSDSGEIKVIS